MPSWVHVYQWRADGIPFGDAHSLEISSAVGEYDELGSAQLGNPDGGANKKPNHRPKHQEALENCFNLRIIQKMSSNRP